MKRGTLNVPVIGVAKAGWNLEQFKARANDSSKSTAASIAAAFEKLSALLRYVDGDYADPATFEALRKAARRRPAAGALSGHPAGAVRNRGGATGEVRLRARARG